MCMSMKAVRRKRWSLVRVLATCLPDFLWRYLIPITPKMLISFNIVDRMSAIKENNSHLDDSSSSFHSFKTYFHKHRKEQQLFNSTPKRNEEIENAKINDLQKELAEIKKQIAKIMEQQAEHFQCSGYGTLTNPDQLQKSFVPPPPPPPPPPLPNILPKTNAPLKIQSKKSNIVPLNGFPGGKELLKDLKKVQLKKVEKSPGGGPIKKIKKVVNDPGDFLEEVLRKRFGLMQYSPESSLESPSVGENNSFSSGTHNNSYEVEKNLKITVA